MALIISPTEPDAPVYACDPQDGFTLEEIERHIGARGKAFRLNTGGLLLVGSLLCGARAEETNVAATCVLRNAVDAPGANVCGPALFLGIEESELLSEQVQAELLLNGPDIRNALLLDRNEEVRQTITLGLEKHLCRVIQARMAVDAVGFCQKHKVQLLLADISSLEPHALETLRYLREAQPQASLLLISGYDRYQVDQWYPRLLDGIQFLQKPFNFGVLGVCLGLLHKAPKVSTDAAMACHSGNSS